MAAPTFDGIEVAVDGARGELHLNLPDKLNPLSHETRRELGEAARWFDAHPDLKVVVVSGRGRAFSAGADVVAFASRMAEGDEAAIQSAREDAEAGRLMGETLEAMAAVTIAKIHGHCIGGGFVLASACDLRVAAEGTRFLIPEVDLGIPLTWGGIPRLVRDIGPALTKELVMTCRPFDAAEAREIGFLNRVVPAEELDASVDELAAELAAKPNLALLTTKRRVNEITDEMVGMHHSSGDDDAFVAGVRDPEGNEAAARYLGRVNHSG